MKKGEYKKYQGVIIYDLRNDPHTMGKWGIKEVRALCNEGSRVVGVQFETLNEAKEYINGAKMHYDCCIGSICTKPEFDEGFWSDWI